MNDITLLIASTNHGKIHEITQVLQSENFPATLMSLKDFPSIPEPDEPFETFIENAVHKAQYYAQKTGLLALSDDSGVLIEALDGFPGVGTKDYSKTFPTLQHMFQDLNERLKPHDNKTIFFKSAVALHNPITQQTLRCEDYETGTFTFPGRGDNGFGYDPIFTPEGYNQTMAEVTMTIKNTMSHRAKAMRQLIKLYSDFK